jgi:hypothetical protein
MFLTIQLQGGDVTHNKGGIREYLDYLPYYEIVAKNIMLLAASFFLFYIFNKSTPEICYIPSKSTENSKKNFLAQRPLHQWS